ncbi:HAMP domain-containing sensor histidine kinase [Olsenella sp. DNF00959]|uniref:sensor histidine kinase n=1 Tax=Olsenella sp. DNF00959 TaxID=1476999 RepID=UPI000782212E|nr:HAMP domain-containing sensor histidine kinase [Olsenella sp. DNF00959]KXB62951.1 ATPase/histidine kinase/DNA gyrase B/HSP90 domain protein [Olsenella sp. DNF00959]
MVLVGPMRRTRIPLALVISRYFLYVLVVAVLSTAIPTGVFAWQLQSGNVLAANYGETHLDEVRAVLASKSPFDSSDIPSAYRYARFGPADELLESDMGGRRLDVARVLAAGREGGDSRPMESGSSFYATVELPDGGRCVLCYDIVPQWSDKGVRDALPDPQGLLLWAVLLPFAATVSLIALRAGRVLTRKMAPLVQAAEAVGRQDLDVPVGKSDVVEVDDVLRAMEGMRLSLRRSLEAQRAAEQRGRDQVAALAHDLKTPLTVALGNAELLDEDAARGRLGGEQAACVRAIRDATLSMDAFVGRIVEASRGHAEVLDLAPVDPAALADGLEGEVGRLVSAHGLLFGVSREPSFRGLCDAIARGEVPTPRWDEDALARAVLNLADNACEHARGGRVTLVLSGDSRGISIAVEDDGEGFSPDVLAHGAERFWREDKSRTSGAGSHFGLGLSIASDVASAHGGRLELSNRQDGGGAVLGARAAIVLPLAQAGGVAPMASVNVG